MKTSHPITIPNWDDIIFSERNKLYGAYAIRKKNDRRLITSLFYTLSAFSLVFVFLKLSTQKPEILLNTAQSHQLEKVVERVQIFEMNSKPQGGSESKSNSKPPSWASKSMNYLVTNTIDNTDKKADTSSISNSDKTNLSATSNPGTGGTGNNIDSTAITGSGNGSKTNGNESWVEVPEVFPEFPGGETKMFEFLSRTLRFPRYHSLSGNKSITVYMSFVVNKNGEIEDIRIERSGGREFDEEAIKAVNKMPKWKPGSMGKVPVSVRFRLPIKFTLRD